MLNIRDSNRSKMEILNNALESLRAGADASRAYIFENIDDDELGLCIGMVAEVCAPGIKPQVDNPVNKKFPTSFLPSGFISKLREGRNFGGAVVDLFDETPSLRDDFVNQDPPLLSIQIFPVFIQNRWWGFIGFDDCTTGRQWNEWEIMMLQTASDMVGNTVNRWEIEDHLNETLDQLELQVDKRTAQLLETNRMLNLEIQQRTNAQNDLQQRLNIEERLSRISTNLLKTHQIKRNMNTSLKDLAQIMDAGRIFLLQFDINNYADIIEFLEWHKPDIQPIYDAIITKYVDSLSGFRERLRNHETIFIPDISQFLSIQDINDPSMTEISIKSLVLSPLVISRRIHGILGCGMLDSSPKGLKMNIRILDLAASMFTSLIQRQKLIQNLESQIAERTRQLTTFLDMAMFGEGEQNLTDVLQPIIRSISSLIISDAVCIHIINGNNAAFALTAQY